MGSYEHLTEIISGLPGAIVAFSGGTDSAFLSDVSSEILGDRMIAVTAVSPSLAPAERSAAAALAAARGWTHEEISTDELARDGYRQNGPDRCYHCKSTLFDALAALARARNAAVLVGTNADDAGDFRPGIEAARERGVLAPLLEAGLTKEEIRAMSLARGLPTHDKPASACLASRIAYGVEVTPERLDRIARAEEFLRAEGFLHTRVRDHGTLARVEVSAGDLPRLVEPGLRARIVELLKEEGFDYATVDLEGFRSGSMNAPLLRIARRRT